MRTTATLMAVMAIALAGCGGGSRKDESPTTAATGSTTAAPAGPAPTGTLPAGAVEPPDAHEEDALGTAATEASPEASPEGPSSTGELGGEDRSGAIAAVSAYIEGLDRHDGAAVCAMLAPGALDLNRLPKQRRGCRRSLEASIGTPPRGGAPAWRKTALVAAKPEDLGDGRARVSTTVTHHFSDRKYVSVEDDVVYLQRAGGRWLLAKPSATLYRAVGYASPPLDAFTPPPGWR